MKPMLGICGFFLLGLALVGDSAAQVEYGKRLGLQQGAEARLMTLSPEVYLAAL